MADSRIQDLPAIDSLADGDLFPIAREGDGYNARKVTAGQMTAYIDGIVQPYAEAAENAAATATSEVGKIGSAVSDAQTAAREAEAARDIAVTAGDGLDEIRNQTIEAAEQAFAARDQYPRPESGTWQVYNPSTGQYEDSGEPSALEGKQGIQGEKGEPGNSMTSLRQISGDHSPGTKDTYEVVLSDGSTGGQFEVYNGADGGGAGDMVKSVYDPQNKNTDIFSYIDQAVQDIPVPDVSAQIAQHNASGEAHQDIRDQIAGLAGGKELFGIEFSIGESPEQLVANATAQEIVDALESNKFIYAKFDSVPGAIFIPATGSYYNGEGTLIFFVNLVADLLTISCSFSVNRNAVSAYYISMSLGAGDVDYDPSNGSLTSDNVQDAIDEVVEKISTTAAQTLSDAKSYVDTVIGAALEASY